MSNSISIKSDSLRIKCEEWFISSGSSLQVSPTDFDVYNLVKRRVVSAGVNPKTINEGLPRLGQKLKGFDEMYLTDFVVGDNQTPGLHEITEVYKGFADANQRYKSPISKVSQNTNTIAIDKHPNYNQTKFSWGQVFGDGDSPNEFGRILEDGAFLRFGPVPDGQDGRQGHWAPCNERSNGPHCKLMGVTDYLGAGQLRYSYKILSRERKNHSKSVGKVVSLTGDDVPKLAEFRGNPSDWLLTSFNQNAITLGTDADNGVFYMLEYEFLSSQGGWNRLIYQVGRSISLPSASNMNW